MEPSIAKESTAIVPCNNCRKYVVAGSKFCRHCGTIQEKIIDHEVHKPVIAALVIFYSLELLLCLLVHFNDNISGWKALMIVDGIMAFSAIFFFAFIWHDVKHLLRWKSFSVKKSLLYASAAIAASFIVHWLITKLNLTLFESDNYYYYTYLSSPSPALFMVLMTAISPALFEELAYRGFVMGGLLKIMDSRAAIFISAFVFALIHLSLLSFFWLFPFALALGYLRVKENTIWYGVLVHFCFNGLVCLLEFKEMGIFNWMHI